MSDLTAHEADFHAWALRNAELLREGRLDELDIEHMAEEVVCERSGSGLGSNTEASSSFGLAS